MPESTLRWQSFNQKKPYFIATVGSLALMALAVGFLFNKLAAANQDELAKIQPTIQELQGKENQFKRAYGDLKKSLQDLDQNAAWLQERSAWVDLLREMRAAFMRAEAETKSKLGVDTGVWVETMNSFAALGSGTDMAADTSGEVRGPTASPRMSKAFMDRYFPGRSGPPTPEPVAVDGAATVADTASNSNQVAVVKLKCRGVSVNTVNPGANNEVAYQVDAELKKCPLFQGVKLDPQIVEDPTTGTFSFGINVTLKQPLKL